MMDVSEARAFLAKQRRTIEAQRAARAAEFDLFRPTPTQDECDCAAHGEIVMIKRWDLSPIDPQSFDPFEPPGPPVTTPPPTNTVPPVVTLIAGLSVGQMAVSSTGAWQGSPSLARQWRRGAADIAGATANNYTFVADDIGLMIDCPVTGTNAGGSATALSNAVGPIVAAGRR